MLLRNRTIIVGVTGGIAAYKTADLVSKLVQEGADVWVVMTREAAKLVTPLTFRTLSKNPVITDLFSDELSSIPVPHISVTDKADLIVIAPATANIIGKMAHGIADDALSTMVLASKAPKLIAPAMNKNMWDNRIVQENVLKLKTLGFNIMGPESGWLACGDEGVGRMVDVPFMFGEILELMKSSLDLRGIRLLVTAGGTRESIDPVRFIGNRSSGKMGYAVAKAAVERGANVTLISTPTTLDKPHGCRVITIETAAQMKEAVNVEFKRADAVIMAAAVADYCPSQKSKGKIKKYRSKVNIELQKTDDILESLGRHKGSKLLIGFSLETDDLIENSRRKLQNKNLDLIVANSPEAFESDESEVSFISADGKAENFKKTSKADTADRILDFVAAKRIKTSKDKTRLGPMLANYRNSQ